MDKEKSKGIVDRQIEQTTTSKSQISQKEEKREKKMSSAQKAVPILIVVSVTLAIILLATLIAFFQLSADDKYNSRTLESVYASSYYTMVDSINNLQVDSAKFSTLQNAEYQRKCLKKMEQDCGYILSGLSILPIEAQSCMSATKFFNQISGLCESYINQIDENEDLRLEQLVMVDQMSLVLNDLKEQFNTHNMMISQTGYSFIDASVFNDKGINEFSTTLGSLSNDAIEYPTMIFDGPFSASLENTEVNGLPSYEITQNEAEVFIREKVFYNIDDLKIKYIGSTKGDFETYDFSCEVERVEYDVQITIRGGKLLTMSCGVEPQNEVMNKDEAISISKEYLRQLGYENMGCVWSETNNNILYLNMAPIENGIIFYPDLIKIKVDLGNQKILGIDAKNYCYNHVSRNYSVSIDSATAKSVIVGDYIIKETRLALIPLENKSEVLCYEILAEGISGDYYFYVNAGNKNIEKALKIVTQNGTNKLI